MRQKIMPPTYFYALLLLSITLHFILPVRQLIVLPYRYLGIVLIAFGTAVNVWTDNMFKSNKTTVKPRENPTELITSGPFRLSRHPMYLGMTAALLGVAILLGSLIAFVFPIIFVILMELLFIPLEEKNLQQAFGSEYSDYRRKARRWI
jgi:protein-S-isoprenylcysteine O-methyltransferase Ste14